MASWRDLTAPTAAWPWPGAIPPRRRRRQPRPRRRLRRLGGTRCLRSSAIDLRRAATTAAAKLGAAWTPPSSRHPGVDAGERRESERRHALVQPRQVVARRRRKRRVDARLLGRRLRRRRAAGRRRSRCRAGCRCRAADSLTSGARRTPSMIAIGSAKQFSALRRKMRVLVDPRIRLAPVRLQPLRRDRQRVGERRQAVGPQHRRRPGAPAGGGPCSCRALRRPSARIALHSGAGSCGADWPNRRNVSKDASSVVSSRSSPHGRSGAIGWSSSSPTDMAVIGRIQRNNDERQRTDTYREPRATRSAGVDSTVHPSNSQKLSERCLSLTSRLMVPMSYRPSGRHRRRQPSLELTTDRYAQASTIKTVTLSGAPASSVALIRPSTAPRMSVVFQPRSNLSFGHRPRQAVGAQQEAVAGTDAVPMQVERQRLLTAHGPRDGVARPARSPPPIPTRLWSRVNCSSRPLRHR